MKLLSLICLFSCSLYGSSFEDMVKKYNITEAHYLSYHNDLDKLKSYLDEHNQLMNAVDKYGNTALHYAAYYNRKEVAKLILDHGAYVDINNKLGHTPLFLSSLKGHQGMSILLCKYNADLYKENAHGQTPFSLCDESMKENLSTVSYLLKK